MDLDRARRDPLARLQHVEIVTQLENILWPVCFGLHQAIGNAADRLHQVLQHIWMIERIDPDPKLAFPFPLTRGEEFPNHFARPRLARLGDRVLEVQDQSVSSEVRSEEHTYELQSLMR